MHSSATYERTIPQSKKASKFGREEALKLPGSKRLQKVYEELVDHSKSSTWLLLNKLETNPSSEDIRTLPTDARTEGLLKTTERGLKDGSYFADCHSDESAERKYDLVPYFN